MRVSNADDNISHAVIGQQETVSMGISDDAALMHILSSTLYTHTKLAAVREIICNGWDAHISSNITDKPLQISITDTEISIRDFGTGIPHDKIGSIYGIYGNSTKRTDQTVTGGFGLGSKAPFAYTDNFQVTSHHNGTKTIYHVSRASMEHMGKPSINKIVSLPTEETGIEVSFSIKSDEHDEFLSLINEVLYFGEILGSVNNKEPIEVLPLSKSKSGYILAYHKMKTMDVVNIKYGNVVYPVPECEVYNRQFKFLKNTLTYLRQHVNIIFLAKPNSLSIAPNREALILTDDTIKTISRLLNTIKKEDFEIPNSTYINITNEIINEAIHKEENLNIDDINNSLLTKNNKYDIKDYSFTVKQMLIQLHLRKTTIINNDDRVLLKRLYHHKDSIKDTFSGKLIKHLTKKVGKHFNSSFNLKETVFRFFIAPLLNEVKKSSLVKLDSLYFPDRINGSKYGLIHYKKIRVNYLSYAIEHLSKNILLVNSKEAATDIINSNPNKYCNYYVWVISRNTEAMNNAEEICKNLKLHYKTYFLVKSKKAIEKKYTSNKPARVGYLSLTDSYCEGTRSWLLSTARERNNNSNLKSPIAWVILNSKVGDKHHRITEFDTKSSLDIYKLFGDKIAVVTKTQADILNSKGVPNVDNFINNYVDDTLPNKPEFITYLTHLKNIDNSNCYKYGKYCFIGNMVNHQKLLKKLKLPIYISPETQILINIYKERNRPIRKLFPKCNALAETITTSTILDDIKEKLDNSPYKELVSFSALSNALEKTEGDKLNAAYDLISKLLK